MLLFLAVLAAIFIVDPPWDLVLIVIAGIVEVAEVGFWLAWNKRRHVQVGAETLIGATGAVTVRCDPVGQVRVRGETWAARCEAGADVGDEVRIVSRDRLTLTVEPT
jgi:membrane protein implicated in regulation of membrane protease activity